MKRTRLSDRQLPVYTKGEELFNAISHMAGVAFGIAALIYCLAVSASKGDIWGIVSGAVYGASLVALYSMSAVYHGLPAGTAKKVMQVMDHCTIYFLIAGSYTPVVLCPIRSVSPAWGWAIFAAVWGCAVLGTVFTAIDLKKYSKFSMVCYIGMGWCIVAAAKVALQAVSLTGLLWLLLGGIAYTVGAVLYGLGRKHRYMHSLFHIFVLAGSVLQFIAIGFHVL